MTRGERLFMWLLDVSCRAREAAYAIAPTDERQEACRRAEASYAAHMNLYAGAEPTDPEERDESACSCDPDAERLFGHNAACPLWAMSIAFGPESDR